MNLKMNLSDAGSSAMAGLRGLRLSAIEMVFLTAALVFAGVVTYFYLTQAQPRTSHLAELRERNRVAQEKLAKVTKERQAVEEQRQNAEAILGSLKEFEGRLKDSKHGISAIIDELNARAKENNVTAGDVNFVPHESESLDAPASVSASASPAPSATPKLLLRDGKPVNVYEGLGIETTVEGDYHDLRRFISAFEQSNQFVIINAISLQSVDEKTKRQGVRRGGLAGQPGQPQGQPMGAAAGPPAADGQRMITVSLKIQMETYFQREPSAELPAKAVMTSAPARNR